MEANETPLSRVVHKEGSYSVKEINQGFRVYKSGQKFNTGYEDYEPTWIHPFEGEKKVFIEGVKIFRSLDDAKNAIEKVIEKEKAGSVKPVSEKQEKQPVLKEQTAMERLAEREKELASMEADDQQMRIRESRRKEYTRIIREEFPDLYAQLRERQAWTRAVEPDELSTLIDEARKAQRERKPITDIESIIGPSGEQPQRQWKEARARKEDELTLEILKNLEPVKDQYAGWKARIQEMKQKLLPSSPPEDIVRAIQSHEKTMAGYGNLESIAREEAQRALKTGESAENIAKDVIKGFPDRSERYERFIRENIDRAREIRDRSIEFEKISAARKEKEPARGSMQWIRDRMLSKRYPIERYSFERNVDPGRNAVEFKRGNETITYYKPNLRDYANFIVEIREGDKVSYQLEMDMPENTLRQLGFTSQEIKPVIENIPAEIKIDARRLARAQTPERLKEIREKKEARIKPYIQWKKDKERLTEIKDAKRVSSEMIDDLKNFIERRGKLDEALEFVSSKTPVNYGIAYENRQFGDIRDALLRYAESQLITWDDKGNLIDLESPEAMKFIEAQEKAREAYMSKESSKPKKETTVKPMIIHPRGFRLFLTKREGDKFYFVNDNDDQFEFTDEELKASFDKDVIQEITRQANLPEFRKFTREGREVAKSKYLMRAQMPIQAQKALTGIKRKIAVLYKRYQDEFNRQVKGEDIDPEVTNAEIVTLEKIKAMMEDPTADPTDPKVRIAANELMEQTGLAPLTFEQKKGYYARFWRELSDESAAEFFGPGGKFGGKTTGKKEGKTPGKTKEASKTREMTLPGYEGEAPVKITQKDREKKKADLEKSIAYTRETLKTVHPDLKAYEERSLAELEAELASQEKMDEHIAREKYSSRGYRQRQQVRKDVRTGKKEAIKMPGGGFMLKEDIEKEKAEKQEKESERMLAALESDTKGYKLREIVDSFRDESEGAEKTPEGMKKLREFIKNEGLTKAVQDKAKELNASFDIEDLSLETLKMITKNAIGDKYLADRPWDEKPKATATIKERVADPIKKLKEKEERAQGRLEQLRKQAGEEKAPDKLKEINAKIRAKEREQTKNREELNALEAERALSPEVEGLQKIYDQNKPVLERNIKLLEGIGKTRIAKTDDAVKTHVEEELKDAKRRLAEKDFKEQLLGSYQGFYRDFDYEILQKTTAYVGKTPAEIEAARKAWAMQKTQELLSKIKTQPTAMGARSKEAVSEAKKLVQGSVKLRETLKTKIAELEREVATLGTLEGLDPEKHKENVNYKFNVDRFNRIKSDLEHTLARAKERLTSGKVVETEWYMEGAGGKFKEDVLNLRDEHGTAAYVKEQMAFAKESREDLLRYQQQVSVKKQPSREPAVSPPGSISAKVEPKMEELKPTKNLTPKREAELNDRLFEITDPKARADYETKFYANMTNMGISSERSRAAQVLKEKTKDLVQDDFLKGRLAHLEELEEQVKSHSNVKPDHPLLKSIEIKKQAIQKQLKDPELQAGVDQAKRFIKDAMDLTAEKQKWHGEARITDEAVLAVGLGRDTFSNLSSDREITRLKWKGIEDQVSQLKRFTFSGTDERGQQISSKEEFTAMNKEVEPQVQKAEAAERRLKEALANFDVEGAKKELREMEDALQAGNKAKERIIKERYEKGGIALAEAEIAQYHKERTELADQIKDKESEIKTLQQVLTKSSKPKPRITEKLEKARMELESQKQSYIKAQAKHDTALTNKALARGRELIAENKGAQEIKRLVDSISDLQDKEKKIQKDLVEFAVEGRLPSDAASIKERKIALEAIKRQIEDKREKITGKYEELKPEAMWRQVTGTELTIADKAEIEKQKKADEELKAKFQATVSRIEEAIKPAVAVENIERAQKMAEIDAEIADLTKRLGGATTIDLAIQAKIKGLYIQRESFERGLKKDPTGNAALEEQIKIGMKVEEEHTKDPLVQRKIALDHLKENVNYYTELKKAEKKLEDLPKRLALSPREAKRVDATMARLENIKKIAVIPGHLRVFPLDMVKLTQSRISEAKNPKELRSAIEEANRLTQNLITDERKAALNRAASIEEDVKSRSQRVGQVGAVDAVGLAMMLDKRDEWMQYAQALKEGKPAPVPEQGYERKGANYRKIQGTIRNEEFTLEQMKTELQSRIRDRAEKREGALPEWDIAAMEAVKNAQEKYVEQLKEGRVLPEAKPDLQKVREAAIMEQDRKREWRDAIKASDAAMQARREKQQGKFKAKIAEAEKNVESAFSSTGLLPGTASFSTAPAEIRKIVEPAHENVVKAMAAVKDAGFYKMSRTKQKTTLANLDKALEDAKEATKKASQKQLSMQLETEKAQKAAEAIKAQSSKAKEEVKKLAQETEKVGGRIVPVMSKEAIKARAEVQAAKIVGGLKAEHFSIGLRNAVQTLEQSSDPDVNIPTLTEAERQEVVKHLENIWLKSSLYLQKKAEAESKREEKKLEKLEKKIEIAELPENIDKGVAWIDRANAAVKALKGGDPSAREEAQKLMDEYKYLGFHGPVQIALMKDLSDIKRKEGWAKDVPQQRISPQRLAKPQTPKRLAEIKEKKEKSKAKGGIAVPVTSMPGFSEVVAPGQVSGFDKPVQAVAMEQTKTQALESKKFELESTIKLLEGYIKNPTKEESKLPDIRKAQVDLLERSKKELRAVMKELNPSRIKRIILRPKTIASVPKGHAIEIKPSEKPKRFFASIRVKKLEGKEKPSGMKEPERELEPATRQKGSAFKPPEGGLRERVAGMKPATAPQMAPFPEERKLTKEGKLTKEYKEHLKERGFSLTGFIRAGWSTKEIMEEFPDTQPEVRASLEKLEESMKAVEAKQSTILTPEERKEMETIKGTIAEKEKALAEVKKEVASFKGTPKEDEESQRQKERAEKKAEKIEKEIDKLTKEQIEIVTGKKRAAKEKEEAKESKLKIKPYPPSAQEIMKEIGEIAAKPAKPSESPLKIKPVPASFSSIEEKTKAFQGLRKEIEEKKEKLAEKQQESKPRPGTQMEDLEEQQRTERAERQAEKLTKEIAELEKQAKEVSERFVKLSPEESEKMVKKAEIAALEKKKAKVESELAVNRALGFRDGDPELAKEQAKEIEVLEKKIAEARKSVETKPLPLPIPGAKYELPTPEEKAKREADLTKEIDEKKQKLAEKLKETRPKPGTQMEDLEEQQRTERAERQAEKLTKEIVELEKEAKMVGRLLERTPMTPEKEAKGQKIIDAWKSGAIEFASERDELLAREGLKPDDFGMKPATYVAERAPGTQKIPGRVATGIKPVPKGMKPVSQKFVKSHGAKSLKYDPKTGDYWATLGTGETATFSSQDAAKSWIKSKASGSVPSPSTNPTGKKWQGSPGQVPPSYRPGYKPPTKLVQTGPAMQVPFTPAEMEELKKKDPSIIPVEQVAAATERAFLERQAELARRGKSLLQKSPETMKPGFAEKLIAIDPTMPEKIKKELREKEAAAQAPKSESKKPMPYNVQFPSIGATIGGVKIAPPEPVTQAPGLLATARAKQTSPSERFAAKRGMTPEQIKEGERIILAGRKLRMSDFERDEALKRAGLTPEQFGLKPFKMPSPAVAAEQERQFHALQDPKSPESLKERIMNKEFEARQIQQEIRTQGQLLGKERVKKKQEAVEKLVKQTIYLKGQLEKKTGEKLPAFRPWQSTGEIMEQQRQEKIQGEKTAKKASKGNGGKGNGGKGSSKGSSAPKR